MTKKAFIRLKTDKTFHSFKADGAHAVKIPPGHILADVEVTYEDSVSAGVRYSILQSRDICDEERIPTLGINRHSISWNRQKGTIDVDSTNGGIDITLCLVYKDPKKVEWYTADIAVTKMSVG